MLKGDLIKASFKKINQIIYKDNIIFMVIFIILFAGCSFANLHIISWTLEICAAIISLIILLLYIFNCNYSKFIYSVIIYFLILFVSTIFNKDTSIYELFLVYYKDIAIVMYLELIIKKNLKGIVNSMCYVYTAIITINFLTILIFRNGMYKTVYSANWFLGYKNVHIFTFIPCIVFSFLYKEINNNSKSKYFLIVNLVITFFSVYLCKSATSIISYAILLIYIFAMEKINKLDFINILTYCATQVLVFFTIVIGRLQNIFSWLIINILHKDLKLNNRTVIWDKVISLIKKKPILGYGFKESEVIGKELGNKAYSHAHNTILGVLYQGGIINLVSFLLMLYLPLKELYIRKKNKIVKFISLALFCMMLTMNFEARQSKIGLYIILSISYNIKDIISFIENNKLLERKENANE